MRSLIAVYFRYEVSYLLMNDVIDSTQVLRVKVHKLTLLHTEYGKYSTVFLIFEKFILARHSPRAHISRFRALYGNANQTNLKAIVIQSNKNFPKCCISQQTYINIKALSLRGFVSCIVLCPNLFST